MSATFKNADVAATNDTKKLWHVPGLQVEEMSMAQTVWGTVVQDVFDGIKM